jgi:hypothetical protein
MPDERSPIQHHLVLHRIDPEQGIGRFDSLMLERDLFGTMLPRLLWLAGESLTRTDEGRARTRDLVHSRSPQPAFCPTG